MSVEVTFAATITTVETLETNVVAASANKDKRVTHTGYNVSDTMNSGSTPPATKCAYFLKAMSEGAGTIDLTALTGTNGATVSFSGLKVQAATFRNPPANGNAITVGEGASNGYELGGDGWTFILQPGMSITIYGNDATPDVGGSTKTIDIAGTGSQALEVSLVAG